MTLDKNPRTGNPIRILAGRLLKIPDTKPIENKTTGKFSRLVHIEVLDKHDKPRVINAFVNQKNFDYGLTIGKSYRTVIEKVPGRKNPWVTMSHLEMVDMATDDLWDWDDSIDIPTEEQLKKINDAIAG